MVEPTPRAAVHMLLAMREQIDALLAMLAPTPDAVEACRHQSRTDLTTIGSGEHWVCNQCGYEHQEDADGSET